LCKFLGGLHGFLMDCTLKIAIKWVFSYEP
jgi:hypothetical protein